MSKATNKFLPRSVSGRFGWLTTSALPGGQATELAHRIDMYYRLYRRCSVESECKTT